MAYSAVMFDLDGTLLDTLADIGNAVNRVLAAHGWPTHPLEQYRTFVGEGVTKLISRAVPPDQRDARPVAGIVGEYGRDYAENWAVDTRPYDGVPQLLDELTRRGIRMTVLSNKPDGFTQQCVAKFLGRWSFAAVMGASPRFAHKPDPAAALDIARQLGIAPAEFLYLGDSNIDMQTACNAGMRPAGALWGFRGREELVEAGAKHLLAGPLDLLNLL